MFQFLRPMPPNKRLLFGCEILNVIMIRIRRFTYYIITFRISPSKMHQCMSNLNFLLSILNFLVIFEAQMLYISRTNFLVTH